MRILYPVVVLIGFIVGVYAQEQTNPYQRLIDKVSPSIVSVEVVVKMELSYGGESNTTEQKTTTIGTILTPDGLVMVSAMTFSTEVFQQMMGQGGDSEQFQFKLTPQSFKVYFAGEPKPLDAELVATDSQIGIGFLRIKALEGRTLTPAAFKEAPLSVGQELMTVFRLSKGFDYSPVLQRMMIGGTISKPRRAFVIGGGFGAEPGTLVYTMEGDAVGVMVFLPELYTFDEDGSPSPFSMLMSRAYLAQMSGVFVLPVSEFKPILEQALQRKSAAAPDSQTK